MYTLFDKSQLSLERSTKSNSNFDNTQISLSEDRHWPNSRSVSSFVCDKTQTTTVVNCRSGTLKLARVATSRFLGAFRYRPVDWLFARVSRVLRPIGTRLRGTGNAAAKEAKGQLTETREQSRIFWHEASSWCFEITWILRPREREVSIGMSGWENRL